MSSEPKIKFPTNTITAIPYNNDMKYGWKKEYKSLRGDLKRDWFSKHAYYCLPLTIANQYGFVVVSNHEFTVEWNGGPGPADTKVEYIDKADDTVQSINSHFGLGIITVQNGFILRTPEGVNLMTINPPNYFIDGLAHMTGVIECDNLRRDFTFNLKVTRPNFKIHVKKGDWIGCVIPTPRYFIDKFEMIDARECMNPDEIVAEQQCSVDFGKERDGPDLSKPHLAGRRYYEGEDVYGNKFPDHQKKIPKHPK